MGIREDCPGQTSTLDHPTTKAFQAQGPLSPSLFPHPPTSKLWPRELPSPPPMFLHTPDLHMCCPTSSGLNTFFISQGFPKMTSGHSVWKARLLPSSLPLLFLSWVQRAPFLQHLAHSRFCLLWLD